MGAAGRKVMGKRQVRGREQSWRAGGRGWGQVTGDRGAALHGLQGAGRISHFTCPA